MAAIKSLFLIVALFAASWVQASPDIQHWTTSNGARVYFVEAHELPMVDVRVVFDAGSARDGSKPGLAVMTNGLLAEGAADLDADAIAAGFEDLGAQFGNEAMRDMGIVSLRSLSRDDLLNPALGLFATVLGAPSFPGKALERERARTLVALKHQEQSPGSIAGKAFYRALYPKHPYAEPTIGTRESVKALGLDDIRAFYRDYYVAANAVVAIVGDLKRQQAERLAEQVVGKLARGKAAARLPKPVKLDRAERISKDFPSTQTHILVGQPGMHRGDPDYFPLYVGNHILGGSGLVSRISNEVREKRGLSYSAYSYFAPMREDGPYQLGLQTANENAEEALKVLHNTLKTFVDKGPTQEELEASKKNITGGFALNIDSNKDIVQYLAMIGFYDLSLDYLDRFIERVNAVSVVQIREAFQRRVHPDRMVTVMVGRQESQP